MLTADQARQQSKTVIEQNSKETEIRLQEAVSAAIKQGSYKTNFYPRNMAEQELACVLLNFAGYAYTKVRAQDQRDKDYITISWEVV
jgi:hypothetical protein